MHGIIHVELQKYVLARHGRPVWQDLLKQAGLRSKAYLVSQQERCWRTSESSSVPDLLDMYRPLLKPEWRSLDLLEHTERTIHSVVRLRNQGAAPPQLRCRRIGPAELQLGTEDVRRRPRHNPRGRQALRRDNHDRRERVHAPGRAEL
jgi:hypothetical protein